MLYGDASWSEVPISAYKESARDGEIISFDAIIDRRLDIDFIIDRELGLDFIIDQLIEFQTEFRSS